MKRIFDFEFTYFPKHAIDISLYNRSGRLEIIIWLSKRGIKGLDEYKDDWFYSWSKRIKLWKVS